MDLRDVDTDVVYEDGQRCVVRTARSIARESPRKRARQSGTDTVREDSDRARCKKNRFPRGVKCTHLAGPAVSAARAAMGVAMADMCVAIETVVGV